MMERQIRRDSADLPNLAGLAGDFQDAPRGEGCGGFIGDSPVMEALYATIASVAASEATVFVTGESGTGKEVCAEAIHAQSRRARAPFIPINCAAIPRDLMESELFGHVRGAFTGAIADRDGAARLANGGTLFLDEIAEMTPDMQTKLLRFLQDFTFRKVGGVRQEKTDVRIICATNRNPQAEISAGRFREDLFYRLHVLPIHMPPLRERGDDVIALALSFLRRYSAEENKTFQSLSAEVETIFRCCDWPGNIRQLQNVIRHVVVMNDNRQVAAPTLPPGLLAGAGGESPAGVGLEDGAIRPFAESERAIIERAIALCGGNVLKAAAALEISPSTIYRKKADWDKKRLNSPPKTDY